MSAMLAHEIRNPIQTITHGLEIMGKNPATTKQMQSILHDEMLRLNRLVSMMLQYSKPLQASVAPTLMPELIKSSLQQVDEKDKQYVRWSSQVDELPLDGDHFRLVLDNLLSNALKNRMNTESPVELTLSADDNYWTLEVVNLGEIRSDLREKLFDPFVSGLPAGIGLGLATVQQVCAVNGWLINLNTGDGLVCFTVKGPVQSDGSSMVATLEVGHG